MLSALLTLTAGTAHAQIPDCQPGIVTGFNAAAATYTALWNALAPHLNNLNTQLAATIDQPTYAILLAEAQATANGIANGRILISLPDGTVLIDTSKANNTYANFVAKAINENHNSRVAIFMAQEFPCGAGLERKFSTSTGQTETYLAVRSGTHLNSQGTIRISNR
jgi:hypothetical protein